MAQSPPSALTREFRWSRALSQDEIEAWVHTKGLADYLRPEVLDRAGASISVAALGIDLPLSEIYADVEFN